RAVPALEGGQASPAGPEFAMRVSGMEEPGANHWHPRPKAGEDAGRANGVRQERLAGAAVDTSEQPQGELVRPPHGAHVVRGVSPLVELAVKPDIGLGVDVHGIARAQ